VTRGARRETTPRLRPSLRTLIVVAFALIAHAPSLTNGFVLDDDALLARNPYIRSASGLWTMLGSPLFAASGDPHPSDFYRPVSAFVYWLSYQCVHASTLGQHALNVVLHAGVVAALLWVLDAYVSAPRLTLAATVLFAVHPATAEIVAYIGGRQDMLGWLFALAAMRLLACPSSYGEVIAIAASGVCLAMLSRESFVVLAVALPLIIGAQTPEQVIIARKRRVATGLESALGVAVVLLLRHFVHAEAVATRHVLAAAWVSAPGTVALRLVKDVVAPTDLSPLVTPTAVSLWFSVAILLLLGILAVAVRKFPLAAVGAAGILLTMPVHGVIVVRGGALSDRYAYTLLVYVVLFVVGVLAPRFEADAPLVRRFVPALPIALGAALLPLTWARDRAWHDETTLGIAMYEDRPDDPQSKLAMGVIHAERNEYDQAFPLCRAYFDAYPDSARADTCLANYHFSKHDPAAALPYLRHYVEHTPADPEGRAALLATYQSARDYDGLARTLEGWGGAFDGFPEVEAAKRHLAAHKASDAPSP
jgi:protein O-mannosyl-transferase